MRVLAIGGTGSFSTRVTQKSLERGHDVLAYTRGRRLLLDALPVRWLRADRADRCGQRDELARFAPDVVVDSICFDPARAEDLVALFGAARRVVLIRSADVYGEDVGCAPDNRGAGAGSALARRQGQAPLRALGAGRAARPSSGSVLLRPPA